MLMASTDFTKRGPRHCRWSELCRSRKEFLVAISIKVRYGCQLMAEMPFGSPSFGMPGM
jgi:hypothetical protein